jgi:selenophosphate synthetase-related protein
MHVIILLALMNGMPVAGTDAIIYNDKVTCEQALQNISKELQKIGVPHEGRCEKVTLQPI